MASEEFFLIDRTFIDLAEREVRHGAASIDDIERVVLLVWHAAGIIENGGLHFFLERGLSLRSTAEAYSRLGIEAAAAVFLRLLNLFPRQSVPDEVEERMLLADRIFEQNAAFIQRLEVEYHAINRLTEKQLVGWIQVHNDLFTRP